MVPALPLMSWVHTWPSISPPVQCIPSSPRGFLVPGASRRIKAWGHRPHAASPIAAPRGTSQGTAGPSQEAHTPREKLPSQFSFTSSGKAALLPSEVGSHGTVPGDSGPRVPSQVSASLVAPWTSWPPGGN